MKSVLIFGITGSVGVYLSTHLADIGFKVTGVGFRSSDNGFFEEIGIEYLSLDITKQEDFIKLKGRCFDSIVHLAGAMPSKMEGYKPNLYLDTVVKGTLNVLEYARVNKIPKLIFTQTRADSNHFLGTKDPVPSDITKSFPLKGDHSVYTICKNAAVDLIEHYHHEYGLSRFILRLPTIYAYHPDKFFYVNGNKKTKAYRLLMDKAIKSEPIEIWGDPSLEKEITYVKDLVQIIEKAIWSEKSGGVYNVGRGKGVSLEEQIRGIIEVFSPQDNPSPVIYRPEMPDGRQFIHDITKTIEDLGYNPQYDYKSLLIDFKKEMEMNRFQKIWGNG